MQLGAIEHMYANSLHPVRGTHEAEDRASLPGTRSDSLWMGFRNVTVGAIDPVCTNFYGRRCMGRPSALLQRTWSARRVDGL
jgi:hypothetical protein